MDINNKFMRACVNLDLKLIEKCIEQGAYVNHRFPFSNGSGNMLDVVIQSACAYNSPNKGLEQVMKIIETLVSSGSSISPHALFSPYLLAEIAEKLLDLGADPLIENEDGRTASQVAQNRFKSGPESCIDNHMRLITILDVAEQKALLTKTLSDVILKKETNKKRAL